MKAELPADKGCRQRGREEPRSWSPDALGTPVVLLEDQRPLPASPPPPGCIWALRGAVCPSTGLAPEGRGQHL